MSGPDAGTLYYGDCLDWMDRWSDQTVDLIYLDPPFNSKTDYNILYAAEGGETAQYRAFTDTWAWDEAAADRYAAYEGATARLAHDAIVGLGRALGRSGMLAYLTYMAERLEHMHRLLKPTGAIYLHCDPTASHYLKIIMDAIFGGKNFRNEIIWRRTGSHNSVNRFGPIHDVLLFFAKSEEYRHRAVFRPYLKGHVDTYFKQADARGRYWGNSIHGSGVRRGDSGKPWRGYDPTDHGRHWAVPGALVLALGIDPALPQHDKLDALYECGVVDLPAKGLPTYRQYLETSSGQILQDIWAFQPHTNGVLYGTDERIDEDVRWIPERDKRERLGYPTQKPRTLLERIIKASSRPDDLVLDPFCGCGTTVEAADRLGRRWAGIDISSFAIDLIRDKRFKNRTIPAQGIPTDLAAARKLAKEQPFAFESWAVWRLPGFHPNTKQVADGGIDGRATLAQMPEDYKSRKALAQVKGGRFNLSNFRDFIHVTDRDRAALGCFVTLDPVTSAAARAEAANVGRITVSGYPYTGECSCGRSMITSTVGCHASR